MRSVGAETPTDYLTLRSLSQPPNTPKFERFVWRGHWWGELWGWMLEVFLIVVCS